MVEHIIVSPVDNHIVNSLILNIYTETNNVTFR